MTELTGTRYLAAFILRRDRVRILVWISAIGLFAIAT
jgi:putative exporter of polyketide antibiotics